MHTNHQKQKENATERDDRSLRPDWDEYFTNLLPLIKLRASCRRRQVGALIVDRRNRVLSMGYNGPPSGLDNCTDSPCPGAFDKSGKTENCIALHAEHNAIYFAGEKKEDAFTLYSTHKPCLKCSIEILQTPIKRVIFIEDYPDSRGAELLREGGVICEQYRGE